MKRNDWQRFLPGFLRAIKFLAVLNGMLLLIGAAGNGDGFSSPSAPVVDDGESQEAPVQYLPAVVAASDVSWPMAGANPQRTSWVPAGVRGELEAKWAKPIEPYISQKVQIIGAEGKVFVSTARGLYALDANSGEEAWVYPTDMPLGHSPTYYDGVLYVGGFDRRLHAIDAGSGAGLWTFEAGAGFHTNPIVVKGSVLAGNRDGNFYAVHARGHPKAGQLIWKFETAGPILFSPAYADGVVYFMSNDSHAYAVEASTGELIWKTRLNARDFHSWWPVIYHDTVVIVARTNYRAVRPGHCTDSCSPSLFTDLFYNYNAVEEGVFVAPLGQQAGDWVSGTPTLDMSKNNAAVGNLAATEYLEAHDGWHHEQAKIFVLDRARGTELTWDYDGDGKIDYAPVNPIGRYGNGYPPVVGYDDVLYFFNQYRYSGALGGGGPTGWKFGTPIVSLTVAPHPGQSYDFPIDEPVGVSAGGSQLYWNLCCDRFVGGVDISIPLPMDGSSPILDQNRQWRYVSGSGSPPPHGNNSLPDGYHVQSVQYRWNPDNDRYYWAHVDNVGPTVYNDHLYVHRSNAVIALGAGAEGETLPTAETVAGTALPPRPASMLEDELAREVNKMLAAGHLRPGYWGAGIIDLRGAQMIADAPDYFHNPAETVYVLLRALPHLESQLQEDVRAYLQNEFASYPLYQYTHVGWRDGAPREQAETPPEIVTAMDGYGPRSWPLSSFDGWTFNPFNFYVLWKYAEAGLGDPADLFGQIDKTGSRRLLMPGEDGYPSDENLRSNPHVHNAYIAGHLGWLELQKDAGLPESQDRRAELNRLLALRASTFTWDLAPNYHGNLMVKRYYYGYLISLNFMYMVPELADYLRNDALPAVQTAVNKYEHMTPYWFVSRGDEVIQGETDFNTLYHYHSLFQAKAMILQQPYHELEKHIDVPTFAVGDLFYIDNLVATLEVANTSVD